MIDKRVVFCLLLVLLLVFTVVSLYVYKQWKQLPHLLTLPQPLFKLENKKESTTTRKATGKIRPQTTPSAPPKRARIDQSNPTTVNNTNTANSSVVPVTASSTPASVLENVVPLLKEPEILPEPNFNCPTFAPRVEKEYVVYVDSVCRDYALFPTPQEYYAKFPLPLYNVTSVEVIQAMLPRGEYQINVNNQTFYVQEPPNDPRPVTLTIGDYETEALFALEITAQMNASGLGNFYSVTESNAKLVFTRVGPGVPFQIVLTPEYDPYGLVRQTLGFNPGIFADVAGVLNAPFRTVLDSIAYVDIISPDVSKNYYDSPLIARIPVLGGLHGVTEYDPQTIGSRKFWPIQRLTGMLLQFFAGTLARLMPCCTTLMVWRTR